MNFYENFMSLSYLMFNLYCVNIIFINLFDKMYINFLKYDIIFFWKSFLFVKKIFEIILVKFLF